MLDFATHENGQHRIDLVFISPDIQPALKSVRYSPGGLLCTTDHRAILVDFHTSVLFGNKVFPPIQHTPRSVRSNDKQAVTNFIEAMYDHLCQHNAFERSREPELDGSGSHDLVEALDELIGKSGDLGEKRCRRRRSPWYSTELATTRYTVSLLRHYVNGLKVGIDRSPAILQRLKQIQVQIYLPAEYEAAKQLLKLQEEKLGRAALTAENQRRQGLANSAEAAAINK